MRYTKMGYWCYQEIITASLVPQEMVVCLHPVAESQVSVVHLLLSSPRLCYQELLPRILTIDRNITASRGTTARVCGTFRVIIACDRGQYTCSIRSAASFMQMVNTQYR
jgi:hypothetical protein